MILREIYDLIEEIVTDLGKSDRRAKVLARKETMLKAKRKRCMRIKPLKVLRKTI